MHSGVYEQLREKQPDVILFHGLCGWELHAAARYKRENPSVRLYVDSHEDENNSARTVTVEVSVAQALLPVGDPPLRRDVRQDPVRVPRDDRVRQEELRHTG